MKFLYYTVLAMCFSLKSYGHSNVTAEFNTKDPIESHAIDPEVSAINFFAVDSDDEKTMIKKENQVTADSRLKIRLGFYATSNFKRQILITIDKRATDAIDYGFDAKMKEVFPNDLYWVIENNKFIIQAVKNWTCERIIPIGINSEGNGPVKIKIDAIENPTPNMEVYLRDNSTMETYDIVNGDFEIDLEKGEFNDKFSIVFEQKIEIPIEEEEVVVEEVIAAEVENNFEVMEIYVSGYNHDQLTIKKPEEMELTHISMFNVLGQRIKVWNSNLNQKEMELTFHAKKGVHLVVMSTNKGRISKKIIVN